MRGKLTAAASSLFILGAVTAQNAYAEPTQPKTPLLEQEQVTETAASQVPDEAEPEKKLKTREEIYEETKPIELPVLTKDGRPIRMVCAYSPMQIYFGLASQGLSLEDMLGKVYFARNDTGAKKISVGVDEFTINGIKPKEGEPETRTVTFSFSDEGGQKHTVTMPLETTVLIAPREEELKLASAALRAGLPTEEEAEEQEQDERPDIDELFAGLAGDESFSIRRPVVKLTVVFEGETYEILANLALRRDMDYDAVIGRNFFKEAGLLVGSFCEEEGNKGWFAELDGDVEKPAAQEVDNPALMPL